MTASTAPRQAAQTQAAAPRASWPGSLVERALALLAADYRRPTGPIAVAALLAAAVLFRSPDTGPLAPGLTVVLGLLATAPLAVIRRFPASAIGVVLTANAVFVIVGRLSWPLPAVAGWLIALAACPVMLKRRSAVLAVALTEAAVLLATLGSGRSTTPWDATAAEGLAVIAAWGAGEMLRARRQSALQHAAATEQVRYLSERDAVARERASIARELHDVVAHHVSMIAVRAATAPYAITDLPAPGRAAFGEIAEEARTALSELRVVLGVLRTPGGRSGTAPQPRLADLDCLLSRMAGTGTDVTLSVTGEPRPLPGSVELCCYRIVQEALTNAGRHAPGSRVRIELGYQQAALGVTVTSSRPGYARPGSARAWAAAPAVRPDQPLATAAAPAVRPDQPLATAVPGEEAAAAPTVPYRPAGAPTLPFRQQAGPDLPPEPALAAGAPEHGPSQPAAGYGLTGLRERVEMLGGQFQAGPDGRGGFAVSALLPAAPDAAAGESA